MLLNTQTNRMSEVIIFKSSSGSEREQYLSSQLLITPESIGMETRFVSCDMQEHGIWSGVRELILPIVPLIHEERPELLTKHCYELTLVCPEFRSIIPNINPTLTESSLGDEKVRSYPADRAYRTAHGIIDLLTTWSEHKQIGSWLIVCNYFDRASHLAQYFFQHLMKRRGEQLHIKLVVVVNPAFDTTQLQFSEQCNLTTVFQQFEYEKPIVTSSKEARELAQSLEEEMHKHAGTWLMSLPKLVRYWEQTDDLERAVKYQIALFNSFNHRGYYQDGLVYGERAFENLSELGQEGQEQYVKVLSGLVTSYMALGKMENAHAILSQELAKVGDDPVKVHLFYFMSMMYVRFLPSDQQDFALAEAYIEKAQHLLANIEMPSETERHFTHSFLLNGLAFIRVRQRRAADALTICEHCIDHLNKHLSLDQHRLHRSVLIYNTAQVYFYIGEHNIALDFYSRAMEMDPFYSEYYNERGNTYLRIGKLEEAIADYLRAIELSPPYPEVFLNLGQCYKQLGEMTLAADAYSRALDLDSGLLLAYVGRAQAYDALDQLQNVVSDYSQAIKLSPDDISLRSNRGSALYELDFLEQALADFDYAISHDPNQADLYYNRAIVLQELGNVAAANEDQGIFDELMQPNQQDTHLNQYGQYATPI